MEEEEWCVVFTLRILLMATYIRAYGLYSR
jgi:hypothetical protein